MIELDGASGEGGGALVRVALALSAYTGQSLKITNVRANRPNPGLKAQHLRAIQLLADICGAKTNDISLGSQELVFVPSAVKGGNFSCDIGTAGSISLLLQAVLLPCIMSGKRTKLTITGGTCGKWQASVDYIKQVLFPHLQQFAKVELNILKRGYYPKGGGEIEVKISPKSPENKPLQLDDPGDLLQVRGIVNCSRDLASGEVGERIAHAAKRALRKYSVPVSVRVAYAHAASTGGELLLWSMHEQRGEVTPLRLAGSALVARDTRAEKVGLLAAQELLKELDAGYGIDVHLADQILMFMALVPRSSYSTREITPHATTNMRVIEAFLPVKFAVKGKKVVCEKK